MSVPYEQKVLARFWRYAGRAATDACWLWTGGITGKKYGRLNVMGGACVCAHRYSYEIHHGQIPAGASVQRTCGEKLCVNPAHLILGPLKLSRRAEGDRFWSKVSRREPGECWPWIGQLSTKGYGRLRIDRGWVRAHRFSYGLVHGDLPRGLLVRHICHNRRCVNPAHLILGTNADNGRDRAIRNFSRRYTGIDALPRRNWFCHPHQEGAQVLCHQCGHMGAEHAQSIHGYFCPLIEAADYVGAG